MMTYPITIAATSMPTKRAAIASRGAGRVQMSAVVFAASALRPGSDERRDDERGEPAPAASMLNATVPSPWLWP